MMRRSKKKKQPKKKKEKHHRQITTKHTVKKKKKHATQSHPIKRASIQLGKKAPTVVPCLLMSVLEAASGGAELWGSNRKA